MTLKRKMNSQEDKEYWEFVDKTAEKAEKYPVWKRGGEAAKNGEGNGSDAEVAEPSEYACDYVLN